MAGRLDIIDRYPTLIVPYAAFNLPIVIWTLRSSIRQVPEEIEDAALIDGASRFEIIWRIILPLSAPGIATAGILSMLLAWNEFLFALTLTRSEVQDRPDRHQRVHRHVRHPVGQPDRSRDNDRAAGGADGTAAAPPPDRGADARRRQVAGAPAFAPKETATMKAVLFPGDRQVVVVDRPTPEPGPGRGADPLRASAICRSDMGLYYGTPIVGGEATGTGQIVPGHEPAGEVAAVGPGVTAVKVGDRVAAYLAIGCGHCSWCQRGYLFLCPNWKCLGFDVDGGDADYLVVPEGNCLPLPDGISYEVGAVMTDMVGTQYATQDRLEVSGVDTVAIVGMGPMGSAGVLIAKARGAKVVAVDVLDDRLAMATQLGADAVVNSKETDPVAALRALTGGEGVDVTIDCSATRLVRTPPSTQPERWAGSPSSASRARPRSTRATSSSASS
jgi:propanol-preferring alcohol dehydrogenase